MTFEEIRKMPTSTSELEVDAGFDYSRVHESVLRNYHIVDKIVSLLEKDTPPDLLLELIDDMRDAGKATRSRPTRTRTDVCTDISR